MPYAFFIIPFASKFESFRRLSNDQIGFVTSALVGGIVHLINNLMRIT